VSARAAMVRVFAAAALFVPLIAAPAGAANKIEEVKSAGGITAWLVEDHSLPVVTLDVSFRGGAALDPADKTGVATLAADLLDEGAGDLDSQAFQGRLEDLATSLEVAASEDAIDASLRTVTANLAPALDLLRLALTQPRFDDSAVARVRSQLLAELARNAREPRYISNRVWWRNAFDGHPYARPVRGTPDSIAKITTPDLRAVVRDRFARNVMIIGVVGDVTADQLKTLLDSTFGALPARAADGKVAEVVAAARKPLLLAKLPIPQSVVTFGQPGIKRRDPDWYAAYVVNHVLGGGGFSSRLTAEVREKRGLAYSVYSSLEPMQRSGVILGGVATQNDRVAQSIDIIRAEWRRMRDAGPTEKELEDAKTFLTGSFPLSLDSTGHIAAILVAIQRDGLGIDYIDRRKALIEGVTLDDAKRVAHRLFDPDKLSFVVVGSPDKLAGAQEVAPNAQLPGG